MRKLSTVRLAVPHLSQPDIEAATRALSVSMAVSGPTVQRFEKRLAQYLGMPYAVCVSSGTAALHLSLIAADIKPLDEVIVPAYTYPATANVVELVGAVPVFVDCQPGGVNLDVNRLVDSIGPRTKVMIPVHVFGIPAEMDTVMEIARQHNLIVIEDAACALGAKYRSNHCGTFGTLGCISFHPRNPLTTGEGGAVMAHDRISAGLIRMLRNHGYEAGEFMRPGFNYRMTEFQGSLGLAQLEKFDDILGRRKRLVVVYRQAMRGIEWLTEVGHDPWTEPNIQTFAFMVGERIDRDSLIVYLASQGIEATIGTYCVPLAHYYRLKYGYESEEFPHAWDAYRRCLSLPLHAEMSDADIGRVAEALKSYERKLERKSI